MAHAALLDKLTDGLVTALTGQTAKDAGYRALKSQAVRGLRDKSHARTNQFAVKARLNGITEKLAVLNRDDLADALQERLEELPSSSKWTPELLSLFLDLSDCPASKTILSHVVVPEDDQDTGPQLTWEEIVADDPLDEPGVWDDVDRGYHSSADNSSDSELDSEPTVSTSATSVHEDLSAIARLHLSQPDMSITSPVHEALQNWKEDSGTCSLSELTLVREMLLMLHGLPTNLFSRDSSTGRVTMSRRMELATTSTTSVNDVVTSCVKLASALNYLRMWIRSSQSLLYMRAVQAELQKLLKVFDDGLVAMQRRYIEPHPKTVVSIVDVATEAHASAVPLVHLSSIVQVVALSTGQAQQLVMLDTLYDEACLAQVSGATASFLPIVRVFCAALRGYLRPIAAWTMFGRTEFNNHEISLVVVVEKDCALGHIWRQKYAENCAVDGSVLVPNCLAANTSKLFALGKSRAFFRLLQPSSDDASTLQDTDLPNFESMQHQLAQQTLLLFPQLLDEELQSWITRIGNDCTPQLLNSLWHENYLSRTMAALPNVFFSADGVLFQDFATAVETRVIAKGESKAWNDQFMLAELARNTLGTCEEVDADCIQIHTPTGHTAPSTTRALDTFSLEYKFPWPIQNITGCSTSSTHAKVFAFLLQVHYAGSLLTKNFFSLRSGPQRSAPHVSLRQKLLWFTEIIHFFITSTARTIHQETLELMLNATDIDAMIAIWQNYDRRLQTNLLLSANLEPVRDTITGILELSELLARTTRAESVKTLLNQFNESLNILVAAIRGLSRAGGAEMAMETLAERLEWSGVG
ncbi:Gamma-tubulin complex component [Sphaerulina musiva]